MSLVVERELQSGVAVARGLAVSRALRGGDLAGFREQAERFLTALPPGASIIVADADGQQLLNTARPQGQRLPMRGDPAVVRRVFETDRPAISELFIGRVLQQPVISADVPVVEDGRVLYDLALNYPLERFAEIISQQRPPANWTIGVFDRAGTTVARVPNAERFIGQRASPSFYPHLIARSEGVVVTQTHEGVPALTAFSRSEPSGWSVGIGLPEKEFTAPLWQSLMTTVLLGMAFLMLGLGLAFWIARGIAEPQRLLRLALAERDRAPDPVARPGGDRSGRPRSHRNRPRRSRRGRASTAPGDRRTPHRRAGAPRLGGAIPPDPRERQGIRDLRPRCGRPDHDLEHRRRAHPRLP